MKMKGLITKKSNLDVAKELIDKYFNIADCGLFDSRNLVGDSMTTVYDANGLTVDICYRYSYFEVFGLSPDEFKNFVTTTIRNKRRTTNGRLHHDKRIR